MKNGFGSHANDGMKAHLEAQRRMANTRLASAGLSHMMIPAGTPTAALPARIARANAQAVQSPKRTLGLGAKRHF
jgi:hypothetical protein